MLRACHCQIPQVNQTNCRPHTHVGRRESWCRGCRESVSLMVRMRGEGGSEASQSSLCKLDLGRKIVGFRDVGNACSQNHFGSASKMLDTCATRVCKRNQNTHPLNLNPQIMYPSRTGIHETTICQTELDPYQPAKALSKHLICANALRWCAIARSLTLPLAFPGGNPSTKLLASNAMSRSSIET